LGYILGDFFTNSSGHPVHLLHGYDKEEDSGEPLLGEKTAEIEVLRSHPEITFMSLLEVCMNRIFFKI
jgi:hypothetical protein